MKGVKRLLAVALGALLLTAFPLMTAYADWEKAPSPVTPSISQDSGTTRGAPSIEHDIPAETQRVEDGGMKRGSTVGSTGYGSAPGFPATTGPGNVPPFNTSGGTETRGAAQSSGQSSGSMSSGSILQQDQSSMQRGATDSSMMSGATDSSMQRGMSDSSMMPGDYRSSYQQGYTEGFTSGLNKSEQAHGTMPGTRGSALRDSGMRGMSDARQGYTDGYRDGFKDGFTTGVQ